MIKRKFSILIAMLFAVVTVFVPMSYLPVAAAQEDTLGDVDGDAVLSSADIRDIMKHLVGIRALTEQQQVMADYTQDGVVNSADARMMLLLIANTISTTTTTASTTTTTFVASVTSTTSHPATTTTETVTTTSTTAEAPTTTTTTAKATTTTTTITKTTTTTKTTTLATGTSVFYGIDVSYAQGTIDWTAVQQSGVDFAIIRCGYGQDQTDQDDEMWDINTAACEKIGMPYGAYFFCYARNASEAIGEAKHALRLLEGKNLTLPVFLDMEYSDYQGNLSNEEYAAIAKYFCTTLSNAGYKVGVYANLDWWDNRLTDPCFDKWYRWVAQYNDECQYEGTYHLWQYSDKENVAGVTENTVDVNYCYVDFVGREAERRRWI